MINAMIRLSPDRRVIGMNHAMRELLGRNDAEALMGSEWPEGLFLSNASRILLQELLTRDLRVRGMRGHVRRPDGRVEWAWIDAVRVNGEDGQHECDELYVNTQAPVPSSFRPSPSS